jgi:50S ribosomal protein L16 3-hydroxylase
MKQHCPHPDLLQVDPFDAIIDEEMEPGDILYIPPGFPHEGYSLENSLNYSVGYRAPNARELFSGFADYILQRELGSQRYADPDVPSRDHPADILPAELDRLRDMMLGLINQPEHFKQWFGEFITQSRHELDVAPPSRRISLMRFTMRCNRAIAWCGWAGCACCVSMARCSSTARRSTRRTVRRWTPGHASDA